MNTSLPYRLFLAICIALLASCDTQPQVTQSSPILFPSPTLQVTPSTPIPFPSPTQTKSEFRYDWKTNWLTNPTCAPPCWEGIIPGQTSLQEAIELIKNIPGFEITATFRDGVSWTGKSFRGHASVGETGNTISYMIMKIGTYKNINIQEAIDVFGEPPNIQVFACGPSCFVNIIYPNFGLALGLEIGPTVDGVVIKDSLGINSFVFFKPGLDNYSKISTFQGFVVNEWNGYGTYQEHPE